MAMKKEVSVYELRPGMVVTEDVIGKSGQLLIRRGVTLNDVYIRYLKQLGIRRIAASRSDSHSPNAIPSFHIVSVKPKKESSLKPTYAASFHQELISELPALVRKMLASPPFGDIDRHQIAGHLESMIAKPEVLDGLFKVKLIEENLFRKTLQVAILATAMGRKMGLTRKQLDNLTIAALLYDMGTFWIDRQILSKTAPFDEKDKQKVESHTVIGYSELAKHFDEEIARVAYQHHERHDGSGYPNRTSGDKIDLLAKIVSICDVYVSLITPRPFRPKYEPIEVLEYMMGAAGTLFDPNIVDLFLQIIPVYSIGSPVELTNRCIGVVVETEGKPLGRPVVEILFDENGRAVQNRLMDLAHPEHLTVSIKKLL